MEDEKSQHELTEDQIEAIEDEIRSTQPLTSAPLPVAVLAQQYSSSPGNEGFLKSVTYLARKYRHVRKVRGDGNCYYRAFLYGVCESLLSNNDGSNNKSNELQRLKSFGESSLKWICQFGYDAMTIELFHEELLELLQFIQDLAQQENTPETTAEDSKTSTNNKTEEALQKLHERLNEENSTSDYCTWFLRVLTAAQMKSDPDRYLPFLLADDADAAYFTLHPHATDAMAAYCAREVEPMGRDCNMVQVAALAEAWGVKVVIEYMDGKPISSGDHGDTTSLVQHVFGDQSNLNQTQLAITLLYRPGHYDILYQ